MWGRGEVPTLSTESQKPMAVATDNTITKKDATRFIYHTADWHLGANRYKGEENLLKIIRHTCTEAIESGAELMVLPGDVFDKGVTRPELINFAADELERVIQAGLPIIAENGNHGRNGLRAGERGVVELLRKVGVTVYTTPGVHRIETRNGGMNVLGVPWMERDVLKKEAGLDDIEHDLLDDAIADYMGDVMADLVEEANLDSKDPLIISSHVTLSNANIERGAEKVINPRGVYDDIINPIENFQAVQPTYIAGGHIHHEQHGANWGYAGSPQEQTFGEAGDPKGSMLVGFDMQGGIWREQLIAPTRRLFNARLDKNPELDVALDGLAEGMQVKVHLAPGESLVPTAAREMIEKAGAHIEKVKPGQKIVEANTEKIDEGLSTMEQVQQYVDSQDYSQKIKAKVMDKVSRYLV